MRSPRRFSTGCWRLGRPWPSDRSIGAIVVTGAGDRAFCTGMDLKAFAERGGPRPINPNVHEELRVTPLHCDIWMPTVVAVNGVCTGAGLHFIADADIVVAASTRHVPRHACERWSGGSDRAHHSAPPHWTGQRAPVHCPWSARPNCGRRGTADRPGRRGRRPEVTSRHARSSSPSLQRLGRQRLSKPRSGRSATPWSCRCAMRCSAGWDRLLAHRGHPDSAEGPRAFAEKREAKWQ